MNGSGMPQPPAPDANGKTSSTAIVAKETKKNNAADKNKKKKKPNVAANIFAVLLFLLMAGGLFIGMAGTFLTPSSLYLPSAVENTTLKGSLAGIVYDGFWNIGGYIDKTCVDFTSLGGIMSALANLLPAISLLILAICIVYALIATLIALFSRMNGLRALQIISSCMLVGYGGCGFLTLIFGAPDYGALALAGVGFLVAFITTMIAHKQIGVLNAFISLLSIAATALFALPSSPLRAYALEYSVETADMIAQIVGLAALGILYLNLLVTTARICAKKGKIFDLIFRILLFGALTTVFVMAMLSKQFDLFEMFLPVICSVGAPALALIALVFAIVIVCLPKILEKKKAKKEGREIEKKDKKDKKKGKI
ncbi:MAG: hypothetical protein OSJ39_05765, partial [Clostridia bacterium]|nr:hypothetical protein [Clostridia bacterium]